MLRRIFRSDQRPLDGSLPPPSMGNDVLAEAIAAVRETLAPPPSSNPAGEEIALGHAGSAMPARERFTLHHSVAVRWWATDLPDAPAAARLLEQELLPGRVAAIAPEGIATQTLQAVLQHMAVPRNAESNGPEPALAGHLAEAIGSIFQQLVERRILRLKPRHLLAEPATLLTARYSLPGEIAQIAALAIAAEQPLLVADAALYQTLTHQRLRRHGLRAIWLPDYHRAL